MRGLVINTKVSQLICHKELGGGFLCLADSNRYEMPTLSVAEESIGKFIMDINRKIHLNEQINQNLPTLGRSLRVAGVRHAA